MEQPTVDLARWSRTGRKGSCPQFSKGQIHAHHEDTSLGDAYTILKEMGLHGPNTGNIRKHVRQMSGMTTRNPEDRNLPQDFFANKREPDQVISRNDLSTLWITSPPNHSHGHVHKEDVMIRQEVWQSYPLKAR